MKITVVLILLLLSCTPRTTAVDNANRFEIVFFDSYDTSVHTGTSQHFINSFAEVLRNDNEEVFCDSSGMIRFFRDNSLLYKTYFTTEITGGIEGCNFVLNGKGGKRLTYLVGMYFDELFYKLRN
jgi:hypothetical protein